MIKELETGIKRAKVFKARKAYGKALIDLKSERLERNKKKG